MDVPLHGAAETTCKFRTCRHADVRTVGSASKYTITACRAKVKFKISVWTYEWQWHQLGQMQICTLTVQPYNDASIPPLSFLKPLCIFPSKLLAAPVVRAVANTARKADKRELEGARLLKDGLISHLKASATAGPQDKCLEGFGFCRPPLSSATTDNV